MSELPSEIASRVRDPSAVPAIADELAERFGERKRSLYLVGGSVRGLLQGRLSGDLDFATDAPPDEVLSLVAGWHEGQWTVGIEFGTVGVRKDGHRLEITTFRGDRYSPESRHPRVSRVSTIEEDLARRDFTINAMAIKLPERSFIDPFDGIEDLAHQRLRTPLSPEESFSDDPLRMLRAARFSAQLEVVPEPALIAAMHRERKRLEIVSSERIRDELIKIVAAPFPSRGLDLAVEAGLAELFLPELPALRLEQDPIHRHKDVYRHSLAVLENLVARDAGGASDVELRLAGLLHDIGKPATRRYGPNGVSFHHHEVVGARMAAERLRALHFPAETIRDIARLIELHLRFHEYRPSWSDVVVSVMKQRGFPSEVQTEVAATVARSELDYSSLQSLIRDVEARMGNAGVDDAVANVVGEALTARQKMFGSKPGWKDAAVRRYVRDAGFVVGRVNALVQADVTTRNPQRARRLALSMAMFESRIARLAVEENLKQIRPVLNGDEVMAHLRIPPGPHVGEALTYLLEVRLEKGEIEKTEALPLLDAWARERGITRRT